VQTISFAAAKGNAGLFWAVRERMQLDLPTAQMFAETI
jgi:hypothetical protein